MTSNTLPATRLPVKDLVDKVVQRWRRFVPTHRNPYPGAQLLHENPYEFNYWSRQLDNHGEVLGDADQALHDVGAVLAGTKPAAWSDAHFFEHHPVGQELVRRAKEQGLSVVPVKHKDYDYNSLLIGRPEHVRKLKEAVQGGLHHGDVGRALGYPEDKIGQDREADPMYYKKLSEVLRYTTPEHKGFVHAINTKPNDRLARDAYADYLEENDPNVNPELIKTLRKHRGGVWVHHGASGTIGGPRLTWNEIAKANSSRHPDYDFGHDTEHEYDVLTRADIDKIGHPFSGPGGHYFLARLHYPAPNMPLTMTEPENVSPEFDNTELMIHRYHPETKGISEIEPAGFEYLEPNALQEGLNRARELAETPPEPPTAPVSAPPASPPPPPPPPTRGPKPITLNDLLKPRQKFKALSKVLRYSQEAVDLIVPTMTNEDWMGDKGADLTKRGVLADAYQDATDDEEGANRLRSKEPVIYHEGKIVPAERLISYHAHPYAGDTGNTAFIEAKDFEGLLKHILSARPLLNYYRQLYSPFRQSPVVNKDKNNLLTYIFPYSVSVYKEHVLPKGKYRFYNPVTNTYSYNNPDNE